MKQNMAGYTQNLRLIVIESGVGQVELSQAIGVAQSTVCRFLQGHSVRSDVIDSLCEWSGVAVPKVKPHAGRLRRNVVNSIE